jgi:hypothetical protein
MSAGLITLDTPEFSGTTIFCDDIRQEAGGKLTLVGVYSGVMLLHEPSFPIVLPKLTMLVNYQQRQDKFINPERLVIFMPGDSEEAPSISADIKMNQEPISKLPVGENQIVGIRATLEFAPFEIRQYGQIKVRIERDKKYVRAGSLAILPQKTAQADLLTQQA